MIKVNEMRVGTLVMDGSSIVQVNSRMIAMVEKDEAEFDPIPLSEDILLRLGFEKRQFHQRAEFNLEFDVDNQKHFLEVAYPRNIERDVIVYFDRSFYKHIQYLHQLMNLYFALTGTELTLNP